MRKYYTRPCNFYYGNYAKILIAKKKALSLAGNKNIAFDQIEIFQKKRGIAQSKIYPIDKIKNLSREIKATINTDIKAYISRDGSAYTSAVTLASQGTTGGHTILTANGVDLSGITSGTSMRWKIETLNQSAAKETRIQAVSLGWS